MNIKDRKLDKEELVKEVLALGGKPARKSMWHCFEHTDNTASAQIKRSENGFWYYTCYTCGTYYDVFDLESRRRNMSVSDIFAEHNQEVQPRQYYYKNIDDLVDSIEDVVAVEEINPYTNPDNGNIDLLTVRYRARGNHKKEFCQAYQTPKGFIKKRPKGQLPLFNRMRLTDSTEVIYVEGEGCVRELTKLGFTATTGSGGSNTAYAHDYSPLSGKKVYLWADYDEPGKRYMEQVREKLTELDPAPEVFEISVQEEQSVGDDVKDLCQKVIAEGGTEDDCKAYIKDLLLDASEVNKLEGLETLLEDMREGRYTNLPLADFPLLTTEARMLLNKRIGIIYGNASAGKSLFIGKICDELALSGVKVARLQLEDELEQHLLRTLAQQSVRSEITKDDWHRANPVESKLIFEQFRPQLEALTPTIIAGEEESWDAEKILNWAEFQLKLGKELVVIDPVSVCLTEKVWLTSHKLMWGAKALMAKYPQGRIVFVSHNNTEDEIAGGQSFRRFSHCVFLLNRFKQEKTFNIINRHGEEDVVQAVQSITIVKCRYGSGMGIEIAVKLDTSSLTFQELGIVTSEVKKNGASPRDTYRDISSDEL